MIWHGRGWSWDDCMRPWTRCRCVIVRGRVGWERCDVVPGAVRTCCIASRVWEVSASVTTIFCRCRVTSGMGVTAFSGGVDALCCDRCCGGGVVLCRAWRLMSSVGGWNPGCVALVSEGWGKVMFGGVLVMSVARIIGRSESRRDGWFMVCQGKVFGEGW